VGGWGKGGGLVRLRGYVGYYLGGDPGTREARRPTVHALAVSATVTASFALLFGLAGMLAGLAASAMTSVLPWIGTAVGVGLILPARALASPPQVTPPPAPPAA